MLKFHKFFDRYIAFSFLLVISANSFAVTQMEEFMLAVGSGEYEKVLELYNKGIEVNKKVKGQIVLDATDAHMYAGDDGKGVQLETELTPLYVAVAMKQVKIVEFLLKNGANPNIKNGQDRLALNRACIYEQLDIVKLLLQYGADVDANGIYGRTALASAVFTGNLPIVQELLNHSADIDLESDVVVYTGMPIEIMINSMGKQTPVHFAISNVMGDKNLEVVKFLIMKGADIDTEDVFEETLLHKLVFRNNAELVKLVLDKDVDLSRKNHLGKTALELAKENNAKNIITLLENYVPPKKWWQIWR